MDKHAEVSVFKAEELKSQLLEKFGMSDAEFDEHENLFDYGLDSVDVMALIGQLQTRGVQVSFVDMVREPTFGAWRKLIDAPH
ncbi:phosphopantetheine-binding protein [Brenneria goodwinii]|uniref:phosphopantetheine-binding protein n=1 Tax=Brenneria goodwinii TaxID=1109412 RepID=UPI0036F04982